MLRIYLNILKLRATQLDALLRGWSDYETMLGQFADGSGSMAKEAEKTANSWEGSMNRLSNTWTDTIGNIADSDGVIFLVKSLDAVLNIINKITGAIGSLGSIGLGVGLFAGIKNVGIFKTIKDDVTGLNKGISVFNSSLSTMKRNLTSGQGIAYSIFSGNKLTQKDVAAITNYANAIKNGVKPSNAFKTHLAGCSVAAKRYAVDMTKAGKSTDEIINGIKEMPKATSLASKGLGLLSAAGNTLVSMGIAMLVSKLVSGVTSAIGAFDELSQQASQATDKYKENSASIDEFRTKVAELKGDLDLGNLSFAEARDARSQLIDIQGQLIDKFGEEAKGIDLVNGSLDDQIEKIDTLSSKTSQQWMNEVNKLTTGQKWQKGINVAVEGLFGTTAVATGGFAAYARNAIAKLGFNKDDYKGGGILGKLAQMFDKEESYFPVESMINAAKSFDEKSNIDRIKDKIENFSKSIKLDDLSDSVKSQLASFDGVSIDDSKMEISGDAKTVAETVAKIQKDVIGSREDLQWLNQDLVDVYNAAQKIIDENWDTYKIAIKFEVLDDKEGLDFYGKLTKAYEEYNDAVTDGDEKAVQKAVEKYNQLLGEIDGSKMPDSFKEYFEDMYPDLKEIVDNWKFEAKITPKIEANADGLKDDIAKLKGLSIEQIVSAFDNNGTGVKSSQWDAINNLNKVATSEGLDLETFLTLLKDAGYLLDQFGLDLNKFIDEAKKKFSQPENTGGSAPSNPDDSQSTSSPTFPFPKKKSFLGIEESIIDWENSSFNTGITSATNTGVTETTAEDKAWENFFKNNPITTQEDLDKFNEIVEGAKSAEEAMRAYAEATKEAGESTASLDSLEKASGGIQTLSNAFKQLSGDGRITNGTIKEIRSAANMSAEEFEAYEDILRSAKKGSSEFNDAMSELTYKILEAQMGAENLASATKEEIASVLEENGILNANAVAESIVIAEKNKKLQASTELARAYLSEAMSVEDLANKTEEEINALLTSQGIMTTAEERAYLLGQAKDYLRIATELSKATTTDEVIALAVEAQQAGITGDALNDLVLTCGVFNNTNLDVSQKVAALQTMGYYANWTAQQMANVANIKMTNVGGTNYIASYDKDGNLVGVEQQKQIKIPAPTVPKITIPSYSGGGGGGSGGKGGGGKSKEDDAKKKAEEAEKKELEQLKAGLDTRKKVLDRYKDAMDLTDFGLDLAEEHDFALRADLLNSKMEQITSYGEAMRKEFDRVTQIIPKTGEQADALASHIESLGDDMRNNVKLLRETQIEMQKLKIDTITSVGNYYLNDLNDILDDIDRRMELLDKDSEDDYKYTNEILNMKAMLPTRSSTAGARNKRRGADADIVEAEQETQDAINDIIETQIEKNEALREDERQAILADMDKMRQDTVIKLDNARMDYETHTNNIKDMTDSFTTYVTNAINSMKMVIPKPDTSNFVKAADDIKSAINRINALLGQTPGAYADGTPNGNAKASDLGIAGENYKPEILIDKRTGEATYIDSPTVIDTSKTDVVGEKATAGLPKFAEGTIDTNYSAVATAIKMYSGIKNIIKGSKGYGAVAAARTFLGLPYVWGGTSRKGVDCSGLTYLAWKQMGVDIGRTTYYQYPNTARISRGDLRPGDLVFNNFGARGNPGPGHVAMYMGNGRVIESPRTGDVVKITTNLDRWTAFGRPTYAEGTYAGNSKAKRFGIAGENFKPEILVDKATGETTYIDKPTVFDLDKTDVVGEKETARIGMFASGTINRDIRQRTNVTAEDIDKLIKQYCGSNSVFKPGMGKYFIEAQNSSGIDALVLFSMAVHESGFGTSQIGKMKSNFFGYGAVDSDPYNQAYNYGNSSNSENVRNGIISIANLIGKWYVQNRGQDTLFKMEHDPDGKGFKYASDKQWDEKIAAHFDKFAQTLSLNLNVDSGLVESIDDNTQAVEELTAEQKEAQRIQTDVNSKMAEIDKASARATAATLAIQNDESLPKSQKNLEYFKILSSTTEEGARIGKDAYDALLNDFLGWWNNQDPENFSQEVFDAYMDGLDEIQDATYEFEDRKAQKRKDIISDMEDEMSAIDDEIEEREYYGDWSVKGKDKLSLIRDKKDILDTYQGNGINIPDYDARMRELDREELDALYEDSQSWIDLRNEKNDWALYADTEYEAWQRVVAWLKKDYPDALDKIHEAESNALEARFNNSKSWIDERNFYNDWELFDDSEVKAWKRVVGYLREEYPNDLAKIKEAEQALFEARKKELDNAMNLANTSIESRKTILQAYHNITNSIADEQHEINKELEKSKTMYEYLDEDTRELLFNQEDYNKLSEELTNIQAEANSLQKKYESDLKNATLDTVESITSEYQMQYETLMKSYEISKADLEIAKKKQKLNNVLNERNVRMLVNGRWQWVANAEEVANARTELADAEYEKQKVETTGAQQEELNELTRQADKLGVVIKGFENGTIALNEACRLATESISGLPKAIRDMVKEADVDTPAVLQGASSKSYEEQWYDENNNYMQDILDATSREEVLERNKVRNAKIPGSDLSWESYTDEEAINYWISSVMSRMAANSAAWKTADDEEKTRLYEENQMLGAAIGSSYNDEQGTWEHLHPELWGISDIFTDKKSVGLFDDLEKPQPTVAEAYAKKVQENEKNAIYIESMGHLVPFEDSFINAIGENATFPLATIGNAGMLWDMSELTLGGSGSVNISPQPQTIDQSQDNRIIIDGLTINEGNSDGQLLADTLRRITSINS